LPVYGGKNSMLNEVMGFYSESLDLKKETKELKPTSKCLKDYVSSLKKP